MSDELKTTCLQFITHHSSLITCFVEVFLMRFRNVVLVVLSAALALGTMLPAASAQQSQLSATQRLDIMRSRLDTMRRTLNSAVAGMGAQDAKQKPSPDDQIGREK